MKINLLWTGVGYQSMENCLVDNSPGGADITSTIVGYYKDNIYRVDYLIKTNQLWETLLLEINFRINHQIQSLRLEGDGKGNWIYNGKKADEFNGCIDVDIPLTPFTNTLPVKRLHLSPKQTKEIQVIYFDLLMQEVRVVRQKYTMLSNTKYHYENVPNDFESTIQVDEFGFVIDYPSLFKNLKKINIP